MLRVFDSPSLRMVELSFITLVLVLAGFIVFAVRTVAIHRFKDPIKGNRIATLVALGLGFWLSLTSLLSLTGFFARFDAIPPPFLLGVVPAMTMVLTLFAVPSTREWLTSLPSPRVIGFQAFRIPVELVLWALAHQSLVPHAMTFEGRNLDIVTGLTAPLVAWIASRQPMLSRWLVIAWNGLGLVLLANVIRIAVLSAPGPFRLLTEEAPNLVPALFPFIWLPYFLVPLALLGHLVSLAQTVRLMRTAIPGRVSD